MPKTLFQLGRAFVTRGALANVDPTTLRLALARHATGDWGDLSEADRCENDLAVDRGDLRIFSAYRYDGLPKFWIITEADRSATTVLLPEEY